jgi:hypothetical protein
VAEREKYGANDVMPGLTGWAQINGRDELEIEDKAKETSQQYDALAELNDFCEDEGIDFLYIQAPYKISEYCDTDNVSGILDFANQNADELLVQLDSTGINYYDIRETIYESNFNKNVITII